MDGLWRFCPDPRAEGETLGFWKPDCCARLWREVTVPSCFKAGCDNLDFYQGICWYRRAFRLPSAWRSKRVVLRFEAVNYRAKVWLNGELLGENRDGFLPFEFEIQEKARWDGENVLAISVDNAHHTGDVPGMHVGWRGYGGILREVSVYSTDFLYIEQLKIVAAPGADGGHIECRLRVRNARSAPANGTLDVAVYETKGEKALLTLRPCAVTAGAGASVEATVTGVLSGARPWSPSAPALYRVETTLRDSSGIVDALETRCGFRRIQAVPEGLLLNGERIFLTGYNRHEDSPVTDMATDLKTTRRDLEQMKEAGCNFVRLCHYPHHPAEIDMCDEIGLLVFDEIPLYFWNDVKEAKATNAARVQTATRQLERLIARDFNHPSVIFWSVSNETPEAEPAVVESNRALVRYVKELDPTRLCVHVSCYWTDHSYFDEDDVICVNAYFSFRPGARECQPGSKLTRATEMWRSELEVMHRKYPSKPILITEFGTASFAGTNGHAFGEDAHARVIEAEFAGMDKPFVCGATIWCWADHPWPPGRFVNGLGLSPYGVVSRDRRKLKPFWTARALFRAKQKLETAPSPGGPSGTGVIMIRPNMANLPVVPFPAGYGIRSMTVDDIGLWTDIQRDAEPHLKITDTLFQQEFGDDIEAIKWRCYIVTDPRGLGIGTISAWYNRDFRGQDHGRIHWVSLRPSHQGKGLAKAALSDAMNRLAQWHDRSYLVTSTERIAAIHIYLNFGFVPDFTPANALTAWRDLGARLKHPALEQALAKAGVAGDCS